MLGAWLFAARLMRDGVGWRSDPTQRVTVWVVIAFAGATTVGLIAALNGSL